MDAVALRLSVRAGARPARSAPPPSTVPVRRIAGPLAPSTRSANCCSARRRARLRGRLRLQTRAPSASFVSSRCAHPSTRPEARQTCVTIRRASRRLLGKHPQSCSKPSTYCRCHPRPLRVYPLSGQGARGYRGPADDRTRVRPSGGRKGVRPMTADRAGVPKHSAGASA